MENHGPAALTSALLVRKGEAAPTYYAVPPQALISSPPRNQDPGLSLRRLWSRMRQARSTTRNSALSASRSRAPERKRTTDARTRITLRVDGRRHLRLRIVAAHRNESLQAVMLAALDSYLDRAQEALANGRCACLEHDLENMDCPGSKDGGCVASQLKRDQNAVATSMT